ncbi:hypothetical protein RB195_011803 [Necator americanus]|uniref:Major sperm protein n=1 Tax=Necator americanus TaxID=51031 RepID=A0ABR1D435_NECAM
MKTIVTQCLEVIRGNVAVATLGCDRGALDWFRGSYSRWKNYHCQRLVYYRDIVLPILNVTAQMDAPSAKSDKEKPEKNLSVDPDCAYFNVTGGKSDHMLVNIGEKRLAVRIRSSNNNLYRVSPNSMFIEPGQCQNLVVVRSAGPARSDKLILQFLPCEKETEDCKEFFRQAEKLGIKPDTVRISLKMVGDQGYRVIPSREVTEDAIS